MDYSFIDDELQKKIETTEFVFLVARAGAGKTFSGDYLECIRGWKHVDGDIPLKNMMAKPEWKAATEQLFGVGEFEGKVDPNDGLLENIKPMLECIARLALEAATDSEKVVVSYATYKAEARAYFRRLLEEAGAKNVSTVFLECDPDNHAEALWDRFHRQSEQSGIPVSETLKEWHAHGIQDLEAFQIWFREESPVYTLFEEAEDSDMPYQIVNNTVKDVTVLDRLDEVFGIDKNTSRGEETYDVMVENIKAIDAQRDQAMYESWEEAMKNETGEDAKTESELAEEEPEKLAVRRSSRLDAKKVEFLRRLSSSTIKTRNRRKSSTDGSLLGKFIEEVLDVVS